MAGIGDDLHDVRLYHCVEALVNSRPAYAISRQALAECLNMRVENGELVTSPGRQKENSTAFNGGAAPKGEAYGVLSGGTAQHVIAENGAYWVMSGNTKTLLSQVEPGGTVTAISGTLISLSGATANRMVLSGKTYKFFMDADGIAEAVTVTAVSANALALSGAYGGSATSGAYTIWHVQTDFKTDIKLWEDTWLFANSTDPFMGYDTGDSQFRPLGFAAPVVTGVSGTSSGLSAGAMTSGATYVYKFCRQRDLIAPVFGQPSTAITAVLSGGNKAVKFAGFETEELHVDYIRVYRTSGGGSTLYYLSAFDASASEWSDINADSTLTTTQEPPTQNQQWPSGVQQFEVFDERIVAIIGERVYIGGRDPTEAYAGNLYTGKWEPDYCPSRRTMLGRNRGEQPTLTTLFILHGRLYAVKERSVWMLDRELGTPQLWRWREMHPNIGIAARWSLGVDGRHAYWLGRDAGRLTVIQFDGATPLARGEAVEGSLDTITAISSAVGGCAKGYYRLSFDATAGGYELEWQTDRGDRRGAWALRDWRHYGYADSPTQAYAAGASGFVYKLDSGLTNAGTTMTHRWQMRDEEDQYPEVKKDWMWLKLELRASAAISALSGEFRVDGGAWEDIPSFEVSSVSAAAERPVRFHVALPNTARGRRLQTRFSSAVATDAYKFVGITYTWRPTKENAA